MQAAQPAVTPGRAGSRGTLTRAKAKPKAKSVIRAKTGMIPECPARRADRKASKPTVDSAGASTGKASTSTISKTSCVLSAGEQKQPPSPSKRSGASECSPASPNSEAATTTPRSEPVDALDMHPAEVSRIRRMTHEMHPYTLATAHRGSGLFVPPEAGCAEEEEDENDDGPPVGFETTLSGPEVKRDEAGRKIRLCIWEGVQHLRAHASVEFEVKIWPDEYRDSKHFLPNGELKPRRPRPQMKASELLKGLRRNMEGDEFIFVGPINGWAAFTNMALHAIIVRQPASARPKDSDTDKNGVGGIVTRFRNAAVGAMHEITLWKAREGKPLPTAAQLAKGSAKCIFMVPAWMDVGWSPSSPGFVWWFSEMHGTPRFLFGESMVTELDEDDDELSRATVTTVHAVAHRYATSSESLRDQNTWHTGVLLEWSHGKFCTLVEVAWLNGCSGYGGKSNWCMDKLEPNPILYQAMADSTKRPYDDQKSEIRMIDMHVKNKTDFWENWLLKYSNKGSLPQDFQRFFDPTIFASGANRVRGCTPSQLSGYCLNYIWRAWAYDIMSANCQTFAADLFTFLTGVKSAPFSSFLRPGYQQKTMAFMYQPERERSAK